MPRECHRVRAACPHEHGDQISGEGLTKACELLCRCRNVFMRSRHVRERCLPGRQKVLERLLHKVATAPGAERSIHPFGKRPCRMLSFWCGRECIWPSVASITRACSLPAACLHLDPEHPRPRQGVSRWLRASPSLQPLPADSPTGIVQASTQYTLAGFLFLPTPHLPFLGFVRHCRFLFFFA